MKRVLITGLSGTSGSAFYDVLCREKYSEKIRVVVRRTTDRSMFDGSPLDLEFFEGDVSDPAFMIRAVDGCDTVFHIASKQIIQPLADAVLQSESVHNVIMISSTIVYSKYYRTLYLAEDERKCKEKFDKKGVKYVFLRPTMIFGTKNDHNISCFIKWFLKWPVFPIVRDGKASIQPVSRLDLAEAYYLVLKNFDHLQKKEYIVSGERKMTLREMFEIICRLSGKHVRFFNVPMWIAKVGVEFVYLCSFKRIDYREKLDRLSEDRAYGHDEITKELGYAPMPFEERVRPLIDSLK